MLIYVLERHIRRLDRGECKELKVEEEFSWYTFDVIPWSLEADKLEGDSGSLQVVMFLDIHCKLVLLNAIALDARTWVLQGISKAMLDEVNLIAHGEVGCLQQVDFAHANVRSLRG